MKPLFIFSLVVLVAMMHLALAVEPEGCFMYQDSDLYCSDLPLGMAQQECSSFEGCNLTEYYFPEKSCADQVLFPHCQQIFCKSSCQYQFRGKCPSGETNIQEKDRWCSPGCCQFISSSRQFCDFVESRWSCEAQANDQDAINYSFKAGGSSSECANLCTIKNLGVQIDTVSIPPVLPNLHFNLKRLNLKESLAEPTNGDANSTASASGNNSTALISGIIIIICAIVIYVFYREKKISLKGVFPLSRKEKKITSLTLDPALYSPFSSNPQIRARIEKMQNDHHHQWKKSEQEELLLQAGLSPTPSTLGQLRHFIRSYEARTQRKIIVTDTVLAKLRLMVKKK